MDKKDKNTGKSGKYSKGRAGRKGAACDAKKDRYDTAVSTATDANYDKIRSNDIEWWNKTPLFADATRIPFNRIQGDPIDRGASSPVIGGLSYGVRAVPGIMAIDFAPTLGTTSDSNSPANRAFTSLYGAIYSKTTGAMQFQQADLALFVTAFSSIVALTGTVKRVLGVSQLYSGLNYYYPRVLIRALGFDPDGIIGHQDEIRMAINDVILSINGLKIPDFMSIYKRQYGLCHNVYADADDVRAQMYAFRPVGYYLYHEAGTVEGEDMSHLSFETIDYSEPIDIMQYIARIEDAIQVWRNSSDLGLIAGSIQRAFSDAQLVTLDYIAADNMSTLPIVDRNITWQINNLVCVPELDLPTLKISQDPVANLIKSAPTCTAVPRFSTLKNWLLNSFDGEIGPEFQMEATRLLPIFDYNASTFTHWNTEIVTGLEIYYTYMSGGSIQIGNSKLTSEMEIKNDAVSGMANGDTCFKVAMLSNFKHAPRVYLGNNITGALTGGEIGDLYVFTTVDRDALVGLNKAALQSVYQTDVPVLG